MNEPQVRIEYDINEYGLIQSPGKFEGEMLYAPHLYDVMLNGCLDQSEDDDSMGELTINQTDVDLFPDYFNLGDVYVLSECEQGFFYAVLKG
ncbi:hypothetical protein LCGC14_2296090 [marine sediment metagenome]|uniref:Uncharacterized protein n=1 Tax=marine sediment metagenome TaxID=412755 RepID=A0A0F9CPV0_9ZZZZ